METKLSWVSNDIIRFGNTNFYARINTWTDKELPYIDVYESDQQNYKNKLQRVFCSIEFGEDQEENTLKVIQAFVDGYLEGYSSGEFDGRRETLKRVNDAISHIR